MENAAPAKLSLSPEGLLGSFLEVSSMLLLYPGLKTIPVEFLLNTQMEDNVNAV